ncbi:MAG TPA: primosomal protein N' [Methylophilaceae bacterium]|nr:primosomal protein N' [Methylophilaceae bacterium]
MQTAKPRILKVALDVPLDTLFDYLDGGFDVAIGQRVLVSFGRREQIGVVAAIAEDSNVPLSKLKPILHAYKDEMPLDADIFRLLQFCSDYYQYPFGQALLSVLPGRLRQTDPATSRLQYCYSLTTQGRAAGSEAIPPRAIIQRRLYEALLQNDALDETTLAGLSSGWKKAIRVMMETGWVEAREMQSGALGVSQAGQHEPVLNPDQAEALQAITAAPGFKPWLLHGITGSGKTEVYIRVLQSLLADTDGQALVLVPEINLTPQLEARFRSRLPSYSLVALHSNLSESERLQNWRLAQSGQARIVIGTRLAAFTPMPQLSVVIVDEEHDASYKQQDSMRYHARDVALVRANYLNIPIVLGSATPALETWHNALSNKYNLLSLSARAVNESRLPAVRCIDISRVDLQDSLAPQLIEAMHERLQRGEQCLLFINRRGYAPVLLCSVCHWIAPCPRCSARLVVHLRRRRMSCHHCGHEERMQQQCPSCGNVDLRPTGHGTQRLEETLTQLFPGASILRVDRDSMRSKHALTGMMDAMNTGKVDILVGTQMLAKGHDFPNLTLVGVVDTDSALFSPDFRASERLFAQLMQVAGRAGRAEKPGEVLIQTTFPEHPLFHALREQNYPVYAQALLQERQQTEFPPFSYMALLKAEANQYSLVERFLQDAAALARQVNLAGQVMVYDPLRPQMERLKGMERGHLLLQANSRQHLQGLLRAWTPQLRASPLAAKVRWAVDVDPLEF